MTAARRAAPAGAARPGSARFVALLRGINVGTAKRVAMADLRRLVESLGYTEVTTLLNSGNVVFTADGTKRDHSARIEQALAARLGVSSKVTILDAAAVDTIVAENPLAVIATNPSRLLVNILSAAPDRHRLDQLRRQDWSPGALGVGTRALYLWCPDGISRSPLVEAVWRELRDETTSRNWATISKLHGLVTGAR